MVLQILTSIADVHALGLTCRLFWSLDLSLKWVNADFSRILPGALLHDLSLEGSGYPVSHRHKNGNGNAELTVNQPVEQGAWRLFHQRAFFVRRLSVDFQGTKLPQYVRVYGFVNPVPLVRRSRAIFPQVTSLHITFSRDDAHLFTRFLSTSLRDLHMSLYPPFPGSALMDSIFTNIKGLEGLVAIRVTFAEDDPTLQSCNAGRAVPPQRHRCPAALHRDTDWVGKLLDRLPSLMEVHLEGCLVNRRLPAAGINLPSFKRIANAKREEDGSVYLQQLRTASCL